MAFPFASATTQTAHQLKKVRAYTKECLLIVPIFKYQTVHKYAYSMHYAEMRLN